MLWAGAWVWENMLLCFCECFDWTNVLWEVVERVWGKIKWGWLKERSVKHWKRIRCWSERVLLVWGGSLQQKLGGGGGGGSSCASWKSKLKVQECWWSPQLKWRLLNREEDCVVVTMFKQGTSSGWLWRPAFGSATDDLEDAQEA